MALSDLQVFSEYAYDMMLETQAQKVELFNAATRGGIVLQSGSTQGDYADNAIFKRLSGLVRRRNAYGTGAVTAIKLEQTLETKVKVASGTPPIEINPGQFRWIKENPQIAGVRIGRQLAEDNLADMLNVGIMCFKAAVGAQATNTHDVSATGKTTFNVLNAAAAKMGDRSQAILCWVLHSKTMHDLFDTALTNSQNLFSYGQVNVIQDGFGRLFVVTDSAHLVDTAPTPDVYWVAGLQQGAIEIQQNDDFDQVITDVTGDENIQRKMQAEWSYTLGVKGFAWDKTNGGHSPSNAALGTATNWDPYVTSFKDLAGVLIKSQ